MSKSIQMATSVDRMGTGIVMRRICLASAVKLRTSIEAVAKCEAPACREQILLVGRGIPRDGALTRCGADPKVRNDTSLGIALNRTPITRRIEEI